MGNKNYHFYVEGEDDRKVVNTLKTDFQWIQSGKVDVFNVVQNELKIKHLRVLKKDTIVVLVFDTDTNNIAILEKNIKFLRKQSFIKEVICIPQVRNLEEELVRSCAIKKASELTKSKSESEFKSDIIKISNLQKRLLECKFKFDKFWSSHPRGVFNKIPNEANLIKK
ncbi:MAG: hypothetical protein IJP06_06220 [Agathobacter sp.]|nr:hypothetical protein [Agathobacter sp.]